MSVSRKAGAGQGYWEQLLQILSALFIDNPRCCGTAGLGLCVPAGGGSHPVPLLGPLFLPPLLVKNGRDANERSGLEGAPLCTARC